MVAGDGGRQGAPTRTHAPSAPGAHSGSRQPGSSGVLSCSGVSSSTKLSAAATRSPTQSSNSYAPTTAPRTLGGATSPRYAGAATADRPMPTPVSPRPSAIKYHVSASAINTGPPTYAAPLIAKQQRWPRGLSRKTASRAPSAAPVLQPPTTSSASTWSRLDRASSRQHAGDHAEVESEDKAAQCRVGRDADEDGRRHREYFFAAAPSGAADLRRSPCRLGRTPFFTLQFVSSFEFLVTPDRPRCAQTPHARVAAKLRARSSAHCAAHRRLLDPQRNRDCSSGI